MFTRNQIPWRNIALVVLACPTFVVFVLIGKSLVYLSSEFIFISNDTKELDTCNELDFKQHIPKIIHQIYGFKDLEMRTNHKNKRQVWQNTHKNYTHYLWNERAVTSLLRREHGDLYNLYKSYGSWIQRADVGRYVVMYHYGGWYVDIDIGCKRGIQEIAEEAYVQKKHLVLRRTLPYGPSNDIFGITPRHPFLKSVLDHLHNANRWFLIPHWNILFSTGSTYMWGRYLNYPCKNDVIVLEEDRYKKYFRIEHDGSWHSWDTGTINFIFAFIRCSYCVYVLFLLLSIIFFILLRLVVFPRLRNR